MITKIRKGFLEKKELISPKEAFERNLMKNYGNIPVEEDSYGFGFISELKDDPFYSEIHVIKTDLGIIVQCARETQDEKIACISEILFEEEKAIALFKLLGIAL